MTDTPTQTLHIPSIATQIIDTYSNLIVGIQGPPGSGKTVSSLTFPEPIVALFERPDFSGLLSLPILQGVKPVIMPFYSSEFVLDKCRQPKSGDNVDHAAAFEVWLAKDAVKLTTGQTLIVDNFTRLQEFFDKVNWSMPHYPTYGKGGTIDDFKPWGMKIDFSERVSNALVGLKCNVVVLFHELQEREQGTGRLLDKVQPLMQGKFLAKLKSYYPNFYRQSCRPVKGTDGKPIEGQMEYVWQVKSSAEFDSKCSRHTLPQYVPANYKSLQISS